MKPHINSALPFFTPITISYCLFALALVFMFPLQLVWLVISGFATYAIVGILARLFLKYQKKQREWDLNGYKRGALAFLAICIFLVIEIFLGSLHGITLIMNNFQQFQNDLLDIFFKFKTYLPESIAKLIPEELNALKDEILTLIKQNVSGILGATKGSLKIFGFLAIGSILALMVCFQPVASQKDETLSFYLLQRTQMLYTVFTKVLGAQVKISAINTVLTGIYLLIILPLFNINIPYKYLLVLFTFLFGLIPVLGNLLSNLLTVSMSLLVSFPMALISIVFLVVIHKLEYYMNATIIGNSVAMKIWELLMVMILMETLVGLVGVILAPVIYGYIKEELRVKNWI